MGIIEKWLGSEDCYGNRLINDWEIPAIRKRLKEVLPDLNIFQGNLKKDQPNAILVDITHLRSDDSVHQEGKQIIISLAHFIRPCPCKDCDHEHQFECYLIDCNCCQDDCT